MKHIVIIAPMLVAIASPPAWTRDFIDAYELDQILQLRWAYGTDVHQPQQTEAIWSPELSTDFGGRAALTAGLRARGDFSDRLEPGRPDNDFRDTLSQRALIGSLVDLELRALYFDIEMGEHFLRLGKQQIVWGEADGLKVLDLVNPQSFREFILPDFDESRIPLWASNLELALGEATSLQLVWIPDQTYNDIPDPGALFAFTSPLLVPTAPAGVPVTLRAPDRPDSALSDSDIGARLSTFAGGWELGLYYLYHYVDRPALARTVASNGVSVTPTYHRSHLLGTSFNVASGDWVARGEAGFSSRQIVLTGDVADADGLRTSGDLSYVFGLDYQGITDTFISGQIFQSVLTRHQDAITRDRVMSNVTALVQRNFRNETVTVELLAVHNLDDGDGVVQLELSYDLRSNVELALGADLFYGSRRGLFGQFARNDRVTLGVEIGF